MPAFASTAPSFPVQELGKIFDHDNYEKLASTRQLVQDSIFVPRHNVSLSYEREIALNRLQRYCENKSISVFDFEKNPMNVMQGPFFSRCNVFVWR